MSDYRFNVRFDERSEAERQAASFLQSMKRGSRNRFVIEAIIEHMNGSSQAELLRQIIREELSRVALAVSQPEEPSAVDLTELTPEEQVANRAEALAALDEFF